MPTQDRETAQKIAQAVRAAGGQTFFVGGCVRDALMGIESDDLDIEVHGLAPEALASILDGLGKRLTMGASFGVYGLKGCGLDIAMPRREHATGRGHKDFEVDVDPFIGTRGAAVRRDFTVNAMMRDVLTGELVDHFGGLADLRDGVLRHVSGDTFGEDPLRVLRGAQFAARFGFEVVAETRALMRAMDLTALSRERILGELNKALLKAERPSVFFRVLREVGQLRDWFPEVEALIGVAQDPGHHPEGDVWNHTMMALDAAAGLRDRAKNPQGFMLAALAHDFGKVETTREIDGRIRSIGHELAGAPLAVRFLERLTNEGKLIRYVENMVRLHMRPNLMAEQDSSRKAFARLFDESVCPEDLLLLARADRTGQGRNFPYAATEALLRQRLAEFYDLMAKPCVTGADLIAAGMKPGVEMGEALRYAHKLRLAGVDREAALRQTLAFAQGAKG